MGLRTHSLTTHWPEAASCIWARVKEPRKATCKFSPLMDFRLASCQLDFSVGCQVVLPSSPLDLLALSLMNSGGLD